MAKLVNSLKIDTDPHDGIESKLEAGVARVAKITKLAKVPTWTKKMSLETYVKQLTTWSEINQDVLENIKYNDLIEELKKNGDIKGLPEYIADHVLPVLENKEDQTITRVTELLDLRYGRSRMERVEEAIEDLFRFREDDDEEDND